MWRKCRRSGAAYAIVCEDDWCLSGSLDIADVQRVIGRLGTREPAWTRVMLHGSGTLTTTGPIVDGLVRSRSFYTTCYAISRRGIELMLDTPRVEEMIDRRVDMVLFSRLFLTPTFTLTTPFTVDDPITCDNSTNGDWDRRVSVLSTG